MPWFWPISKTELDKAREPEVPKRPKVTVQDLLEKAMYQIHREEFPQIPDPQTISLAGRLGTLSSITLVAGDYHWVAQVVWKNGKVYRVLHKETP